MSVVSVLRVADYDEKLLDVAMARHFEALGLAEKIRLEMKVLIKPDLLAARKPEHAATTHPAVVLAVIRQLRRLGVKSITVADSPGGPYLATNLSSVYAACGYKILESEATLNYDAGWQVRETSPGATVPRFNLINPVCDADYIINLPKLKTHSLTGMSGGIKNLFGCIPGLQKPEFHYRCPEIVSFSSMLLDLALTVRPSVTILDAVCAMEGNGPNMGTPRPCGYLLASEDLFAQDYVAAGLMGLEPERIEMLRQARERGLVCPEETVLVGDALRPEPFVLPDSDEDNYLTGIPDFMRGPVGVLAKTFLKPVPRIHRERCVGCANVRKAARRRLLRWFRIRRRSGNGNGVFPVSVVRKCVPRTRFRCAVVFVNAFSAWQSRECHVGIVLLKKNDLNLHFSLDKPVPS